MVNRNPMVHRNLLKYKLIYRNKVSVFSYEMFDGFYLFVISNLRDAKRSLCWTHVYSVTNRLLVYSGRTIYFTKLEAVEKQYVI